jgi:3-oxoacyl-[acyl-carrier-protein] synthase II
MARAPLAVITGMGAVSSLGTDLESHWKRIHEKATGLRETRESASSRPLQYAGQVGAYELPADTPDGILKQERFMSPSTRFGLGAVREAVIQSGLDFSSLPQERKALYVGAGDSTKVGTYDYYPALQEAVQEDGETIDHERLNRATLHKVNPFILLQSLINNLVAFVSPLYQAQGPNTTLASQSPCGAQALELAARSLFRGDADVAIVIGACCWTTPIPLFEMDRLGLLSSCREGARSFRPFDRRHDGFIAGEGAAALIIETPEHARKRSAALLGEVHGFGSFTEVTPTGGLGVPLEAARKAMRAALEEAGSKPGDFAFISPHGNATKKGDRAELGAIAKLLAAERAAVPISGLKAYTGHMGAASDIVEIALGLVALRNRLIPATLNFEKAEKEFEELHVTRDHVETTGGRFLSLSQGFGGQSSAVVISLA